MRDPEFADLPPPRAGIVIPLLIFLLMIGAPLAACRPLPAGREIPWAGAGVLLKAGLHVHTRFSDGQHTVDQVVAAAKESGCDVVAITDHGDAELRAATPAYLDAIAAARRGQPTMTVITGLEWNVPPGKGDEHATVLFPSAMENLETLASFKQKFDDWKREDTSCPNGTTWGGRITSTSWSSSASARRARVSFTAAGLERRRLLSHR
jgi:hypothetical protein